MHKIPEEIAKKIRGKRYICRGRCSTDSQAETSIPGQIEYLHEVGDASGGIWAGDDILLPAVSGSKPAIVKDIEYAIQRKKEKDDFDLILNLVEDRWTRGGAERGHWAEYELLRNRIQVVHVASEIPDGPYVGTMRSMKYDSAKDGGKAISMRNALGSQRALQQGKTCTSSHTNYGFYRLYMSSDGTPLFLIRDMRDGTQQKLHHETRAILETYGVIGEKSCGRFRKQKSDQVFMVLGDEKEVWAVRWIFKRRWIDGWGGRRIMNELTELNIKAPYGGKWTQRQVDVIAENSIYCALGVANLHTAAIYNKRFKDGFAPVEISPVILATKENIPPSIRPPEEWFKRDEPYLRDFLPEPLRGIALVKIQELWKRRARGDVAGRVRNTHLTSLYLLTGLLRAKQNRELLKGVNSGPRDCKTRYYAHPVAQKDPVKAGFPNTTFRADVLEKAVLEEFANTLRAIPDLRDELRLAVEAVINSRKPASPEALKDLQRELNKVTTTIKITYSVISPDTEDEAKASLAELGRQKRQIEAKIREHKEQDKVPVLDVDDVVESLISRLGDLGNHVESLPAYPLRQVLAAFIVGMEADMFTREVNITVRVPENAIIDSKTPISDLCLKTSSQLPVVSREQMEAPPILATIRCEYERVSQKPCYVCRRMREAA